MDINELEKFTTKNQLALQEFFKLAKKSRERYSLEDRIFALEIMSCAITSSLDGENRDKFLTVMNSYSHVNEPNQSNEYKAVADLNVLSADFISVFNELKKK